MSLSPVFINRARDITWVNCVIAGFNPLGLIATEIYKEAAHQVFGQKANVSDIDPTGPRLTPRPDKYVCKEH